MPVLIGVAVLVFLLWAAKRSRKNGLLNATLQRLGGALAFGIAVILFVRGDFSLGVGLGLLGIYLLDETLPWPFSLLAGYLDGRQPGWREHAQSNANTADARAAGGKMTEQEAYQVLGIAPGASMAQVSRAHRSLMKKLHPDQGGTTYLAARVNEAKDVLLRYHR
jgi:hypothetical protein